MIEGDPLTDDTTASVDKLADVVSGTLASRPELEKLLDRLEEGDEVVAWKLDRMGRNTRNVLELIETITSKGASFRSLTEGSHGSQPWLSLGAENKPAAD